MAEKKIRIHDLAKDLDVPSKAIIEKCNAEGIEVKNHMHVVSAGLAATIREWFSEGAHTTTLEESNRVDVQTLRATTKRKKKQDAAGDGDSGVAVMEAPAVEAAPGTAKKKPVKGKPAPETAEEIVQPPAIIAAEPAEESAPEISVEPAAAPLRPAAKSPEPEPPATATPPAIEAPPAAAAKAPVHKVAGPQNIPKPAQLSGPRVVRMDKPDVVDRPRPSYGAPGRPPMRGPVRPIGPALPPIDDEAEERRRGAALRGKAPPRDGEPAADRKHPRRGVRDIREEVNEKLREWRDRDLVERRDRLAHASGRGIGGLRAIEGKQPTRRAGQRAASPVARKDKIELTEPILVKDLSREAGIPVADIIKKLMEDQGQLATINSSLDTDIAQLIAVEHGIELTVVKAKTGLEKLAEEFAALPRKALASRPPVVTVLGHVDHGKTTLLDRIRKANVAEGEAGGITQHIGAYRVRVGERWVTFLDTPGHTAFTAMRARGTNITDVVVLVVAADDGIMPTTVEAINHARAANSTIVVALNKIDLPHDINKIFGQLAEHGLTPSGDWGGETDVVKVSAISGQGIDELLSHLATLSDVMDLKADASLPASGTVIEAERSESLGNVAHVLVQEGTLYPGDVLVCGATHGRVRALRDDHGRSIKEAGPSTPVEVTGLSDVPQAGDRFFVLDNAQRAKETAEEAAIRQREASLAKVSKPTSLEAMLATAAEGEVPELRIIIRADVQGSVDVLKKALSDFPSDQVRLDIMHAGVGTVTESDVLLAHASEAIIVAFHVIPDTAIQRRADNLGVDVRTYKVIYNLIDDIRKALEGLLTPDEKVESRGRAEVRQVFNISRVGKIAGCFVQEGIIQRNHKVRLLRDGVLLKDMMNIESLRRIKDDAKEVKAGFECGIRIAGFDDLKPGDIIESLEVVKIARTLGS